MRRLLFVALASTMALTFGAVLAQRACADDETSDVEVRIRAPLDAVNCGTPSSITVLGLTIDISTANIGGGSGDSGGDGGGGNAQDGGGADGEDGDQNGSTGSPGGGCAALMMGQTVDVRLASDSTPLTATEVNANGDGGGDGGGDGSQDRIQAPVQNVDAMGGTIMVLGLTIDVSHATTEGSDDDSEDGQSQPVDLTQLMPGQIVDIQLASNQAPLTATSLDVKNFANQVEVEVDDQNGNPVGDASDDMDVEVDDTVVVQTPPPAGTTAARPKHVKKVLHLSLTSGSGSVVLSGLPTGRANISVTRVNNGTVTNGRRSLRVRGNTLRSVHVRLRPPRKH